MALTFEDVEDWTRRTGTLENLQRELSQRTTTRAGLQDQLADIRRLEGWEGSTAMRRASPSIRSMTTLPRRPRSVPRTQVGFNTVAVVAGLPELAVRK